MKKFVVTTLTILLLSVVAAVAVYADEIHVSIDGVAVEFEDQAPVIVDDRTFVPVRGVFEDLGFDVDWEQATQTAILTRSDFEIRISIGDDVFTTNGEEFLLDVPAQNINDRTMLPIRAVVESVGYEVDWDAGTRTVLIIRPAYEPVEPVAEPPTEDGALFDFALPAGVIGADFPDFMRDTTSWWFSWTRVQGLLPDFNSIYVSLLEIFTGLTHGVVLVPMYFDAELLADFYEATGERLNAADILEIFLLEYDDANTYFISVINTLRISASGRSAVISLSTWRSDYDELASFLLFAHELPGGGIDVLPMFILLNHLDEDSVSFLEDLSRYIGFDILTPAVDDMERALRSIDTIFGD